MARSSRIREVEPEWVAVAFLTEDCEFDLPRFAAQLASQFPEATTSRDGKELSFAATDWTIDVYLRDDSSSRADSQDMLRNAYAESPGVSVLGPAPRRIEVWERDPAITVRCFEVLDTMREELKKCPGVVLLHPDTGESL
jgi:hypothetical protein